MHISIYYIYIYTCETWRTFLLYKVLIGWLECLRIIVRDEFQGFEFHFALERNKQTTNTTPSGVFGTKDCMIFLLKKNKKREKVKALGREKMSQSPIDFLLQLIVIKNPLLQLMKPLVARLFRHQLSEILDPPSPNPHPKPSSSHCPWITCTEISGSTMYSNLVWIMCCSLGFLKWYRSLYQTSVSIRGTPGWDVWPTQSQRKLLFLSLLMLFLETHSLGGMMGEGVAGSLFHYGYKQVLIIVDMILSWKILWFPGVSEHVLELRALWDKKSQRYALLILIVWRKKKTYSIHLSFRCSWKYTCTVDFQLLIHIELIDVISCFVFAKEGEGGIAFVICQPWFHGEYVRMCIFKRVNISAHGLTSCHSIYSTACWLFL